MKRWQRIVLWTVLAVVFVTALAGGALVQWGSTPQGPSDEALVAMESDKTVEVSFTADSWVFDPIYSEPTVGVIIYPGAHVDPRSYAPLARQLAERGYLAAITTPPLTLAFLDVRAADRVMLAHPDIQSWLLSGHSLGGVTAARYAQEYPETIDGLILMAAYPGGGTDLSMAKIPIVMLRGSEDALVTQADVEAAKELVPQPMALATILGGNHVQFGSYGVQRGDGTSAITPQRQIELTVDAFSQMISPTQELEQ